MISRSPSLHYNLAPPWLRIEEAAADTDGNCEYFEERVGKSRQGVVFELGGWAVYLKISTVKT